MLTPRIWTPDELLRDLTLAIDRFRKDRLEEPLEAYLEAFDRYQGSFESLLETTMDLTRLREAGLNVLTHPDLLEALRYLPGPPISEDDLSVVAEAKLTPSKLREDSEMVDRILQVILSQLDRRRFAWVSERRKPSEFERNAAIIASAALTATQRLGTSRRNFGKRQQELLVETCLMHAGLQSVKRRTVQTIQDAPCAGEFCRESKLGSRKADFIVGLHDNRIMAIECKVSNSATSSIKRLNNDAAAKAEAWVRDFGKLHIVPVAVLSGVYKLNNLEEAQRRGLYLVWAHSLNALTLFMESTRL